MRVSLFLEDAAHLGLLRAILTRVAETEGVDIEVHPRNAVGGSGQALSALREYVRDLASGREEFSEVLVVAIDANCRGVNERVRDIEDVVSAARYPGRCVSAVPDPHVEIWYLADGRSVATVAGDGARQPALPEYKCEPSRYKTLLRDVFSSAGLTPPLGGPEFGDEVGEILDVRVAGRAAPSLDRFVSELTRVLRELRASGL